MGRMKVTPYQNTNDKSSAFGKWFMRAKHYGTLTVEDLSNHIAWDSKVERTTVTQITKAVVKQMKELLMNGHPIRVPHLGLLKVQVSSEGAEKEEDYNASKHIKNAHLILIPTVEIKEELRKMKFEKEYDPTKPATTATEDPEDDTTTTGGGGSDTGGGGSDNTGGGENDDVTPGAGD